jgi:NADH-quinone oxidoreductase subunit L
MTLLAWSWLATLPGLCLTAAGFGRRPGSASVLGPVLLGLAGLFWVLFAGEPVLVRIEDWLPGLPDGALALRVDGLAAVMLCVVGLVSACVYVYSLEYMRGDPGQRRFFVFLDLFVLAMALLVLGGTLATLLIGWAGVGLASFLLIAFWRERAGTLGAGLQALAANAVGDGALLLAVVLLPAGAGDLARLHEPWQNGAAGVSAELVAALLVVGAAAKSAQGPLWFWLPSAMAGPTPVSALIHAATMVAAGVYLLVRTTSLLALAPGVVAATAWLGTLTALASAFASLQQTNFKRGLAYSTVSQLGYMFAAIGFSAPFAALFHLVTHASFKALLFLTAGVVIHAADGEEQLARLGGLRRALPHAALAFLLGTLALLGLPVVTAGAYSKDAILEAGVLRAPLLGWLLVGSVFLTGLYGGRLYWAVFGGPASPRPVHAPDRLLLAPLVPLAAGAVLLGFLAWPAPWLQRLLAPALGPAPAVHLASPPGLLAAALGLLGFATAWQWTRRAGAGARLPAFGGDWLGAVARGALGSAAVVAGWHDGRLGRYVLTAALGIAVLLYLAVRNG